MVQDIVVCIIVFLLNGLEDIFDNMRLEFKFVVFSGNHDNHAWSDLSIISNWIWLRYRVTDFAPRATPMISSEL